MIDADGALLGLRRAERRVAECLDGQGREAAARMERYAKEHRPWTDCTGNARRTLEGRFERLGCVCRVGIAGHMEYSPFLELSHGQRFAILYPTVNALSADILRETAAALSRLT